MEESLGLSFPLLPYGDGLGGLHLPHPVVRFGRPGHLLVPGKHHGLVGGDVCIILARGLVAPSVSLGAPQGWWLCPCPSVPWGVVASSVSLSSPQGCCAVHVPRCPARLLLCLCPSVHRRVVSIVSILILCGDKGWSGHGWSLFMLTLLWVGVVSVERRSL